MRKFDKSEIKSWNVECWDLYNGVQIVGLGKRLKMRRQLLNPASMQPRTIFRLSKYHFQFWTLSGSRYRPPIFYAISVPHRPGATARGDKTSIWSLRLEAIPPRFGTISIPDRFCHLRNAWLSDILCKNSAPFLTTLIARTFKPYKIKDPCWAKSRRELVYCSNRSDIFSKFSNQYWSYSLRRLVSF